MSTLTPHSNLDRRLARLEQQAVWEHAGKCVRDDIEEIERMLGLAEQALAIGQSPEATPTIQLRALTVARECRESAHRIRKETIIDRTIPVLERIDVRQLLAGLPGTAEEVEAEGAAAAAHGLTGEQVERAIEVLLLVGAGQVEPIDVPYDELPEAAGNGNGSEGGESAA